MASTVGIVVSGIDVSGIAETDTEPPVTLRLCVVGEEETGCDARLIEADRANVDGCIIGETTGEPGRHSMRVADRGSVLLRLVAEVRPPTARDRCSARTPPTGSPLASRRSALRSGVATRGQPGRRTDRRRIGGSASTLGDVAAGEPFGHPTIDLGRIEGREAITVVPAKGRARRDVRLTAGVDMPEMRTSIRECVDGCEGLSIEDVDRTSAATSRSTAHSSRRSPASRRGRG